MHRVLLLILLSGLVAQPALAATYFVALTGNDNQDPTTDATAGTMAKPFRTVNRGVRFLKPGDTLYLRAGLYPEGLIDNIPTGTSWSAPVTIGGYPGDTEKATLQPPAGGTWAMHFMEKQSYIIVKDLVLDAINVSYDVVKITCNSTCSSSPPQYAHHIRIQDTELKNSHGDGALVGGDNNEFIRVKLHHNGRAGCGGVPFQQNLYGDQPPGYGCGHGFYITGAYNLVADSEVFWNGGYGIHIYKSGGTTTNYNVVRGTRIHDNGHNTTRWGKRVDPGMILSSGVGNAAYNNIIHDHAGMGIQIDYSSVQSRVFNNTVFRNGCNGGQYGGIYSGAGSSGASIKNNIVFMNGLDAISNISGTATLAKNLVGQDPLFQNTSALDFHLRDGSPAIDAGETLSEVTTDLDGVSRVGTPYDIGAYEVRSGLPLAPTPPTSLIVR